MSRLSYLAVRLEDDAVSSLADLADQLRQAADGTTAGFAPMDAASLHMTFFFAGEHHTQRPSTTPPKRRPL